MPANTRNLVVAAAATGVVVVAAATGVVLAGGMSWLAGAETPWARFIGSTAAPPAFVGSDACAQCHPAEAKLWRSSQHKLAMAHATDASVLGDFNDAGFDYYGVHSRFFRQDGKFFVETDGPDGKLATFEVKYTFGVDPLQQYLIEFPDGRLQALSIAWDSRPKEQGGQRWFHLYPDEEIKHDDVLHWTKLNQNWNFMCAECHSTGVRKNYDAAKDRFATSLGRDQRRLRGLPRPRLAPRRLGARTAKLVAIRQERRSEQGALLVRFDERRDVVWRIDPQDRQCARAISRPLSFARRSRPAACATRAAASFRRIGCPGRSLSDTHVVSPLARGLYHADGQMLDEVYNYGSFKQSKMFAAGVTCGDCHEPHGAKLRAPGDGVCLQCHASDKYAAATHHHHEAVKPAALLRVLPYAGAHLHGGRSAARSQLPRSAARCVGKARNPERLQRLPARQVGAMGGVGGRALARTEPQGLAELRRGVPCGLDRPSAMRPHCSAVLAADPSVPAFARASALTELGPHLSPANINLARRACRTPIPMVRIGALDMLERVPANQLWPLVSPLLSDSNRGVRIRAAALLAAVPTASQPAADRERFERAAAEFIAAQRLNADRPEARATLGNFYARRGLTAEAESGIQGRAAAQPAICARGDQSRRSLSAAWAGRRGRERVARGDRRRHRGTRGCIMRSASR